MRRSPSKMRGYLFLIIFIVGLLNLPSCDSDNKEDGKVAVLITGWGMPQGYNFHYAWTTSDYPRMGDRTEEEGDPCKIGHVGEFPYASHIGMIPWPITYETEGWEEFYDSQSIYWYDEENDMYIHSNPEVEPLSPQDIPPDIPITPTVEYESMGNFPFSVDPRDGTDHLEGWFIIGNSRSPFPNGISDLVEQGPITYHRYYGIMGGPTAESEANEQFPATVEQDAHVDEMLEAAFGDRIDVRYGYYTAVKDSAGNDVTRLHDDVAEEFAEEGFSRMLLARETTDFNNYALEFMTGNFVKERLCEMGALDDMELHMSRQVGRTPEFHTMNVENLRTHIQAFPAGSKIAIIYTTRGLTWNAEEKSPTEINPLVAAHPWSKEVYHENAYLNYLALKHALIKEYGDDYQLVFTNNGMDSDMREDNFFTYALGADIDLKGYGGDTVFPNIRLAIQEAKQGGMDQMLIVPGHWNYDNLDTVFRMKELNDIPIGTAADLAEGIYEVTHCEDSDPVFDQWQIVDCASPEAAVTITTAPSYSGVAKEFATAYYVMLRGALERFGLYPEGEKPKLAISKMVTKAEGATLTVSKSSSGIKGAKIEIPADPYPERPQEFTPETAIAPNDPADTNDAMWEDTVIKVGHQPNPPAMNGPEAVGPAVHFGPYRNIFNRDVTLTIPFDADGAAGKTVQPYVYNHLTEDWEAIVPESVNTDSGLVVFKTKFLGLFMAAAE